MTTNFNWVDYIIFATFFFSILAGLMRGLLREIIALLTWIAACIVSALFSTKVAVYFTANGGEHAQTVSDTLASGQPASTLAITISFICLFLATLLVGAFIGYIVTRLAQIEGISLSNRFGGGLFGLVRAFLVVIVLMFVVQLTPNANQEAWTQSQTAMLFQPAVKWFGDMVEPEFKAFKTQAVQVTHHAAAESENAAEAIAGDVVSE